jgi:biopolymer transport protein ExbD
MGRLKWVLFVILFGCSSSKDDNKIEIKTDAQSEIFINGEKIQIEKLMDVLGDKRENILRKGHQESDLVIIVLLDGSTKSEVAAQIVLTLREMDFRNVDYQDNVK